MSRAADDAQLPDAGYLILKTFARMHREYRGPRDTGYSVPRVSVPAQETAKQYRGISRDPLQAWTLEDLKLGAMVPPTEPAACVHMAKLDPRLGREVWRLREH